MRYRLIIFFCAISFSASAQWWHIHIGFRKHPVLAQIKLSQPNSVSKIKIAATPDNFSVQPIVYAESTFVLEAEEAVLMKTVKHNMSWRIYNVASYNFSDLAYVYMKLHRFSEAKWYLLQSNTISREENDDKHTIDNLVSLAEVKTDIGDTASARADLVEARGLARARGMQQQTAEIEKKISLLDQYKASVQKPEPKYAETAENGKKGN